VIVRTTSAEDRDEAKPKKLGGEHRRGKAT